MKHKIVLYENSSVREISYVPGDSLMQILQDHRILIDAPCGGNGTCGKCQVNIKGEGTVYTCTYWPDKDIEIFLPDKKETKILTHQYEYALNLPLETTKLSAKTSFPVGLAIDLGTTSMVFYWMSLVTGSLIKKYGVPNPQKSYGADVISRITHCSSRENILSLQKVVIDSMNHQIEEFLHAESLPADSIIKISVAANATMLHLLAGVDPNSIALAPFQAQFTEAKTFRPAELSLNMNKEGKIYFLPSVSAYVGADIVSGLASLNPSEKIRHYLFVDIGTNGEMAIVTPAKIYCASTAAGPAFEGANIKCGMGAFAGAISGYNDQGYQTISDTKPIGICGSGLIDIVAKMLSYKIIEEDGSLTDNFIVVPAKESGNGEPIIVSPQDIREIQLAKSAIYTGIKLLVQEANISFEDLDAVYLAGGFGNYMNPESAIKIGILPEEVHGKIITIGNSSGTGAMLHVLNSKFETYANDIVAKSELVDLALHPDFALEFAMNMYFKLSTM